MGEIEQTLYKQCHQYDHGMNLARRILKEGRMVARDCYRWNGTNYWIVGGRLLTREQGEKLAEERKRENRLMRPDEKGYGKW